MERALDQLQDFSEGILVRGGDFNLTLDPILDSTSDHSNMSNAALRQIQKCLFAHQLIDTWRALTPTGKD